jgi:hypothetical protein
MNAIHAELLSLLDAMDMDQQTHLLHTARHMMQAHHYTTRELMGAPAGERELCETNTVVSLPHVNFEIFEAYLAEGVDDD